MEHATVPLLVSLGYVCIDVVIAVAILVKSPRNALSRFYGVCVAFLTMFGICSYLGAAEVLRDPATERILVEVAALLFSLFPFMFLHFMLVFVRRYDILRSKLVIVANYCTALFSYAFVFVGLIPKPIGLVGGMTPAGTIYFLTWISIFFTIGVALLYSTLGGFAERGIRSNGLFIAIAVLMLLLPTPFTLSIFSAFSENSAILYFISSTSALTIAVYIILRHRITMNTPYQALKATLATLNDTFLKTDTYFKIEMVHGAVFPLFGCHEDELIGSRLREFLVQPVLLDRCRKQMLDQQQGTLLSVDVERRDGKTVSVEFSIAPVLANEEVNGFACVARDITERRHAEESLKQNELQLRQITDNMLDLISELDGDLTLKYVSPSHYTILGYAPDQMLGKHITQFMHPEDAALLVSPLELSLDSRLAKGLEYRFRHVNGHYLWLECRAKRVREIDGHSAGVVLSAHDVTERRSAQEQIRASLAEKELLLREIHHRVKNNLQVISSLLSLQSGFTKDSDFLEFFRESENRVRSMAFIHDTLYQSDNLAHVDFAEYVRTVTASLFHSYGIGAGINFVVEADGLLLDIDTALPCGLIVNELVSNALKHAFHRVDGGNGHRATEGTIRIGLRQTDDDHFVLTVGDDGSGMSPAVDISSARSLGLRLVNILVKQLQGTLEVRLDGGTVFTMVLPIKRRR